MQTKLTLKLSNLGIALISYKKVCQITKIYRTLRRVWIIFSAPKLIKLVFRIIEEEMGS
jgi:hypothetical protein